MHITIFKKKLVLRRDGFSLAETLMAVLIMMLAAMIVAAGIPAAKNAYDKVVLTANAETVLSTTISALRNELATARDIKVLDTSEIQSFNDPESIIKTKAKQSEKTFISFYSAVRDAYSAVFLCDATATGTAVGDSSTDPAKQYADGEILLEYYFKKDELGISTDAIPLISSASATNGLYITYESLEYDKNNGMITIQNLAVNQKDTGKNNLAKQENVYIRLLL